MLQSRLLPMDRLTRREAEELMEVLGKRWEDERAKENILSSVVSPQKRSSSWSSE
jgi:hypothetical protein